MNIENVFPSRDNYFVEIISEPAEKKSAGGLIIADANEYQAKTTRVGKIIAVGDGCIEERKEVVPMTYSVGEFVLFSNYAGKQIDLDYSRKGDFYLINQAEIQGYIKE